MYVIGKPLHRLPCNKIGLLDTLYYISHVTQMLLQRKGKPKRNRNTKTNVQKKKIERLKTILKGTKF